MRLTSKERILLYLLEAPPREGALEMPLDVTQEGIARGSNINRRHVPQYIRPLMQEGLVREQRAHVKGVRQRRKVYELTNAGKASAIRLREAVKSEKVRFKQGNTIREATVFQALEEKGGRVPLLSIVRQVMEKGVVDFDHLPASMPTPFVEMLADAPRIEKFVGRQEVLESIVQDRGPGVVVVRGVAGIGKSSLAARTCELLRGTRNLFWHKIRPWDTHRTILADLGDFLAALDRPGLSSTLSRGEVGEAAQVVRDDLPGTRSFLVFDDAQEASAEVLPFLRFLVDAIPEMPDVRALILSRHTLRFYDRRDVVIEGRVREIALGGLTPEEVTAFLSGDPGGEALLAFYQRLKGHPLFLRLARSLYRAGTPSQISRDVRQFIEEQIYAGLTDAERTMMKTASLYRVPVPPEALFSAPGLSVDTLLALLGRSLLGHAGEGGLEVHDSVRDFFADLLSPDEQEQLGQFVARNLSELALKARCNDDDPACVDCLSNALQLSRVPEERTAIAEALGDANERMGDMAGSLIAYKEAARTANQPKVLARLHRKSATLFEVHGDYVSAQREIDTAFGALGDLDDVERGWLGLIGCRMATKREDFIEAARLGESANCIFRGAGVTSGQAEASLELGRIAHAEGRSGVLRDPHFESALLLADSLGDPYFAARVQLAMAEYATYRFGDTDEALRQLAAIESVPRAMGNPQITRRFYVERGFLHCQFLADQSAAARDFAQALHVARKTHDRYTATLSVFGLALVSLFLGRVDEALSDFDKATADFKEQGLQGLQFNARWMAAECRLWLDDPRGFSKVVEALDDPELGSVSGPDSGLMVALRGLNCLLKGDAEGCIAAFDKADELGEKKSGSVTALGGDVEVPVIHMYHGIALLAMGRNREGKEHVDRAIEILGRYHNRGPLGLAPTMVPRLSEVLRRAYRKATRAS